MSNLPATGLTSPHPTDVRERILAVANGLLATGGRDALTTRAVAAGAGVQQPTLYRLFGDKTGLVEAVAEQALAAYMASKSGILSNPDPLSDFREGWDRHVGFGMAHGALFALAWGNPDPRRDSPAAAAGQAALRRKVRALAATGLLRIEEDRAARLAHAACTGAVLSLLELPEGSRDISLAVDAREAVIAAITHQRSFMSSPGPAGAAAALRASLDQDTMLTPGERHLLDEWLDRITRTSAG